MAAAARLRLPPFRCATVLVPAAAFALVLATGHLIEREAAHRARAGERAHVLERLSTVRARLEGSLAANLLLVHGVVGLFALEPDMTQARFATLGRELMKLPNQLRNVAAARDLVITHMYPVEGNEQAIGLDYRALPRQREAALRARDGAGMVVAGPVDLVQGGRGLIGRTPVFLSAEGAAPASGRFWGLVASVIDVDALFAHSGLDAARADLALALRGRDGLGREGDVFDGERALFEPQAAAVLLDVSLPGGGVWQLAATPRGGWSADPPEAWHVRGATLAVGALLALLLWLRARQRVERAAARRRLDRTRMRLEDAIESLSDGFALWDGDDRLVLSNRPFGAMLCHRGEAPLPGARYEEVLRDSLAEGRVRPEGSPGDWLSRLLDSHSTRAGTSEFGVADGRTVRLVERATSDGGTVGIYTDVTQMRRAEEDIRRRANVDPLTGLANRARFLEQLETAIARARRSRRRTALLFVDLDRFKNVNDSLGHDVGDRLLQDAARRIVGCVRETDTVARLGGDEFTVILNDLGDGMTPTLVAEALTDRLSRRFDIAGYDVYAGASIGITLCPDDGEDASTLLKNADMAMYRAKEAGRNTFRFFTQEMTERAQRFVSIEGDLRRALERGELALCYQPIVSLADGALEGVEALLRWQHPRWGEVAPSTFVPVAEESGLIVQIGEWVLRQACLELDAALPPGQRPPRLSVNVSGRQFRAGFDRDTVAAILAETGFPAERLVFEITESTLIDDEDRVRQSLRDFRALGIGLAVDDFGTGFSSLSYLRRFPVTELKIDRSFVRHMDTDAGDAKLVETILAMARALGLVAVAEGVESERQRALLERLGCPLGQGFALGGEPVPADRLWPRAVASRRAAAD